MGKYIIKQTETGFVFHLAAANGETIGTSQVYSSLDSCKGGIDSVRRVAPVAAVEDLTANESVSHPKFQIYLDKGGSPRFRLLAKNGEEILASQGYSDKASCKKGIESVRKNGPSDNIVEPE